MERRTAAPLIRNPDNLSSVAAGSLDNSPSPRAWRQTIWYSKMRKATFQGLDTLGGAGGKVQRCRSRSFGVLPFHPVSPLLFRPVQSRPFSDNEAYPYATSYTLQTTFRFKDIIKGGGHLVSLFLNIQRSALAIGCINDRHTCNRSAIARAQTRRQLP